MFHSITGSVTGHDFPHVYLSTHGIEWEVEVSAATFQSVIAADRDTQYRLFIYLHSREDILKLYGFSALQERHAFLELISVSGIGPRQALKILSGTTPDELGRSLEEEDVAMLTRIPGLGKKTAQRLILQLKGHLVTETSDAGGSASKSKSLRGELIEALSEMGFDPRSAGDALDAVAVELGVDQNNLDPSNEQELFRLAIVQLSRK